MDKVLFQTSYANTKYRILDMSIYGDRMTWPHRNLFLQKAEVGTENWMPVPLEDVVWDQILKAAALKLEMGFTIDELI